MARRDNYSVALVLLIGALYVQSVTAVRMTQQNTINPSDYLFYNMKSAEILTSMEGTNPVCPNFWNTIGINITDTNSCNTEWYLNFCNIYSPTSDTPVAANTVDWTLATSDSYYNQAWVCKGDGKWALYYPTNCSWVNGDYAVQTGHCGATSTPVLAAPEVPTITQPHNFAPTMQASNQVSMTNFDDSAAWEHRVELQNRLSNAVNQATQGLPAGWNVVDITTTTSDSAQLNTYFGQFTLDAEAPVEPTPHHCAAPVQPEPVETIDGVETVTVVETYTYVEQGELVTGYETIQIPVVDVPENVETYETIVVEGELIEVPVIVPEVETYENYETIVVDGETIIVTNTVSNNQHRTGGNYVYTPTEWTYETYENQYYWTDGEAEFAPVWAYETGPITYTENVETEIVWISGVPTPIEVPVRPVPVYAENNEYNDWIPGVPAPAWTYENNEVEVEFFHEEETHETIIITEVLVSETVIQIIDGETYTTTVAGEATESVVSIGNGGEAELVYYHDVESEGESHGTAPVIVTSVETVVENGEATTTQSATMPDGEIVIITANTASNNQRRTGGAFVYTPTEWTYETESYWTNGEAEYVPVPVAHPIFVGGNPATWTPVWLNTETEAVEQQVYEPVIVGGNPATWTPVWLNTETEVVETEVYRPVIVGGNPATWTPVWLTTETETVENVEEPTRVIEPIVIGGNPGTWGPIYVTNEETYTETYTYETEAYWSVGEAEYYYPTYETYTETEIQTLQPVFIPGIYVPGNTELPTPAPMPVIHHYETYTETEVEPVEPVWIRGVPAPAPVYTYETIETSVETVEPVFIPGVPAPTWTYETYTETEVEYAHPIFIPGVPAPAWTYETEPVETVEVNTHYGWYTGGEEPTPVPVNTVVVVPSWNNVVETEEVVYEVETTEEEFVSPVVEVEAVETEPTSYTYVSQTTGNEVVVRFVCPGDAQEKTFLA